MTLFFFYNLICSFSVFALEIKQENFNTHLRWNLYAKKDLLHINKKGEIVEIQSVSNETLVELKRKLSFLKKAKRYYRSITIKHLKSSKLKSGVSNTFLITVVLANKFVDLFSFYKSVERKHVMDFWIDGDVVAVKKSATLKNKVVEAQKVNVKSTKKQNKKINTSKAIKLISIPKSTNSTKLTKTVKTIVPKHTKGRRIKLKEKFKGYRDFRYGAPFVWDYKPLRPRFAKSVNLGSKTPELFYPIEDRDIDKGDQEAHLQLSINLFRKKKWGLMYKSIEVFRKKYGDTAFSDLNEYLKANALLRSNFVKKDKITGKMAINLLINISESTSNYQLQKGSLKYLLNYFIESKEYIQALKRAKKLFVITKEKFDIEESKYAAEAMLYSLARLRQHKVVGEVIQDKTIQKLLPVQIGMAYKIYTLLDVDRNDEVIREYESKASSLLAPIHPVILFNVGEAYFRIGQYEKASKLFDKFIKHYSHFTESSHARLRIALGYDILEKGIKKTEELYRNAINRSQDQEVTYEAKIRYVALKSVRKIDLKPADLEVRSFFNNNFKESSLKNRDLKKLLWIVRLRSFIVDKKWNDALSYLTAVPVNSLAPADVRVFKGDGSSIVYGLLEDNYKQSNYSKVVKIWELYKKRYVDKVAMDPHMNFMVGHAYINLGLYDGFNRLYKSFAKIQDAAERTYPIWHKHDRRYRPKEMLFELKILRNIKLQNWKVVKKLVGKLDRIFPRASKAKYYKGLIAYNEKRYSDAIKHIEVFLASDIKKKSMYDVSQTATLMKIYLDSIYQLGLLDKYKLVASALLKDTQVYINSKHPVMKSVAEYISYMEIEIMSSEKDLDEAPLFLSKIYKFKKRFKNSIHLPRIEYLNALSLIANEKIEKGKEILQKLMKDIKVDAYIKKLARFELSMIRIREATTI